MRAALIKHHAAFERPLFEAKARADWCLKNYLTRGGLIAAAMFDRAAEEHQRAVSREAAARRMAKLPSE